MLMALVIAAIALDTLRLAWNAFWYEGVKLGIDAVRDGPIERARAGARRQYWRVVEKMRAMVRPRLRR